MQTRECLWRLERQICLGCVEEPLVPPLVPLPPVTPTQRPAPKGKALEVICTLDLPPHSNISPVLKPPFFPPPVVGSCIEIWDDNHFLANHTLTQTTTASAFQLGQFSHHSWESLKASCVFGKVQLCRHGSIKSSTEQRSLFKAELFTFVYL